MQLTFCKLQETFRPMSQDSTTRFSNRVEDYVKYRPGYPAEVVLFLQAQYDLTPDKTIADIGAGTGISSALFLESGYPVFAVEPNPGMREKAIALLGHYPGFSATDGTAEHTGLAVQSMDAVIAGQAFHWFDRKAARVEFSRILKPGGIVVLIWNERRILNQFEQEYDKLIIKHAKDYVQVSQRNIDINHINDFFAPGSCYYDLFVNKQVFDFDGLLGRLLSSSYMPARGADGNEAMLADLKLLFDRYQEDHGVTLNYDTKMYTGKLLSRDPI